MIAPDTRGALEHVLERTAPLRDRFGGIVPELVELPRLGGYAPFFSYSTEERSLPPISGEAAASILLPRLPGAGISLDPVEAKVRAVGEAIERYCMSVHGEQQFVRATAHELGSEALDLDRLARCAEDEPGIRGGWFSQPRKDARVRWVKGVSLVDGRPLFVPAIMCYLYFPPEHPGENFWIPISTGCAFHADPVRALVSGICEVIERDSLMLTWLHQLPLPRLDLGPAGGWPPGLQRALEMTSKAGLSYDFFDATSDLGVPTAYALQLADHTSLLANLVMSATRFGILDAVRRTVEEGCSSRLALDSLLGVREPDPRHREEPERIHELEDCALFYAARERREDFRFLLESTTSVWAPGRVVAVADEAGAELGFLLDLFRGRGMEVVAVDLTTPEVREAGFWVLRVLIPELVPMSPAHAIRFLETPRLYTAQQNMGYGPRTRRDVTEKPQPFA